MNSKEFDQIYKNMLVKNKVQKEVKEYKQNKRERIVDKVHAWRRDRCQSSARANSRSAPLEGS